MRRLALVALLLSASPVLAQQAIRDPPGPIIGTSFTCALSGLAATLTECAAVRAGQRYYVTDLVVQTTTSTSGGYAVKSGTGTNCGTATALVFPSSGSGSDVFKAPVIANPTASITLRTPLAVTSGHAICVIGTGTNTINIQISGFYGP